MWTRKVLELVDASRSDDPDAGLYDIEDDVEASRASSAERSGPNALCFSFQEQFPVFVVYAAAVASDFLFLPFIWEHMFLV